MMKRENVGKIIAALAGGVLFLVLPLATFAAVSTPVITTVAGQSSGGTIYINSAAKASFPVVGSIAASSTSQTVTINVSEGASSATSTVVVASGTSYSGTGSASGFADGTLAIKVWVSDGFATSSPVSVSATLDTAAPVVTLTTAVPLDTSGTSEVISWTTNEVATSTVIYGSTTGYGATSTNASFVTSHSITVSSAFARCSQYHYRVESTDSAGNQTIDSDNVFTTTSCTHNTVYTSPTNVYSSPNPITAPIVAVYPSSATTPAVVVPTSTPVSTPTTTPVISPAPVVVMNQAPMITATVTYVPVPVSPFSRKLKLRLSGSDVAALQAFLESKGYLALPTGVANGHFGAKTKAALELYQKSKGISQSGVFGPLTTAAVEHDMMGN